MSQTTAQVKHSGVIDSHVKRVAIVIVLGSIMSILDTTIVNVALESLSKDLHAPLNSVQWVVTAYLLALAAVIPVCGWAVRRYGAFRVYMLALIVFTAGSALCGLASSVAELIVFRVLARRRWGAAGPDRPDDPGYGGRPGEPAEGHEHDWRTDSAGAGLRADDRWAPAAVGGVARHLHGQRAHRDRYRVRGPAPAAPGTVPTRTAPGASTGQA